MKIKILKDRNTICFDEDEYTVDLDRRMDQYTPGDLICYVSPFFGIPLRLEIAIRADGSLAFRSWSFREGNNGYLHTYERPASACQDNAYLPPFTPTAEQIDTVNGLFSGRIRFDGLKLAVGGSVQDICPIDVRREEKLIGQKIYLA